MSRARALWLPYSYGIRVIDRISDPLIAIDPIALASLGGKTRHPPMDMTHEQRTDKAAYLLKALAHPLRLKIVLSLTSQEEQSVMALQNQFNIEQSLLSHHLTSMRDKGILTTRRQGKHIYYRLSEPSFVDSIRALLNSSLIG